mgnify:CR=1 FL=1
MCRPFSTKSEEEYNVRGSTMSGFSIRSRLSTWSEGEYNIKVQYKVKSITTSVFSTRSEFSRRSEFSIRSWFSTRSRFSTRSELSTRSGFSTRSWFSTRSELSIASGFSLWVQTSQGAGHTLPVNSGKLLVCSS